VLTGSEAAATDVLYRRKSVNSPDIAPLFGSINALLQAENIPLESLPG
jgi:hypothetical protein